MIKDFLPLALTPWAKYYLTPSQAREVNSKNRPIYLRSSYNFSHTQTNRGNQSMSSADRKFLSGDRNG